MVITLFMHNPQLKILHHSSLANGFSLANDNQRTDAFGHQMHHDSLDDFPSGLITLY